MTTTNTQIEPAGRRHAIARYQDGRRVIVCQRIRDRNQITDVSLAGGRSYLIEPHVASRPELDALVADYLATAARIGRCPMSRGGWWTD